MPPRPTEAELELLGILWERGPSTVRDVQAEMSKMKETGYTTVLKLLQIMTEKGLVRRNEEARAHVYEPAEPAETTRRRLAGDLLERAFGGSAAELMMGALSAKPASADELAAIRRLLENYEKGKAE